MIFNLIKLDENCKMNDDVNYHHVNTLRLVLSCLTNQNVNYLNNDLTTTQGTDGEWERTADFGLALNF